MRTFVGFGFGAIQAGLFLYEAFRSGRFGRLVVAEVLPDLVEAVRGAGGSYRLNVATPQGVEVREITGLEIYNPRVPSDRSALLKAVAGANELATALPSVDFYAAGQPGDPADVLSQGLAEKARRRDAPYAVIYTAENHNHAAEILRERLAPAVRTLPVFECLNTVIGKMSGVIVGEEVLREWGLASVVPGWSRAFLVEEFNHILISRIQNRRFERGLTVFEEKDDLLPFEEAKLYGHNAIHALLGYTLRLRGRAFVAEAVDEPDLLELARAAFIDESGRALCRKYAGIDPLFTEAGFARYAGDLLARMLNPYLRDIVARVTRDTRRKLGWNDRLVGGMRLVLAQGITPERLAIGAAAALRTLANEEGVVPASLLPTLWAREPGVDFDERKRIEQLILEAESSL